MTFFKLKKNGQFEAREVGQANKFSLSLSIYDGQEEDDRAAEGEREKEREFPLTSYQTHATQIQILCDNSENRVYLILW